jgi:aspartyl/asparaginyl beta-hydroxylase (cupin superfamily)
MTMTQAEADGLIRAAAQQLESDPAAARAKLDRIIATGGAGAQIWLIYSDACKRCGDFAAQDMALDEVLKREPRALIALIWKGDARTALGDRRAATTFYERAVALADQAQTLPAEQRREVDRARAAARDSAADYRAHTEARLAAAGIARSPRFAQSLDLLFGDKQIYPQKPSLYYFPELPLVQFYDGAQFDWGARVEAETDTIRAEIQAVMAGDGGFQPYLVSDTTRPRRDFHGMHDNPAWSSLHLWENGAPVEANVQRCPRTFELLMDVVPLPHISVRAPAIMFSLLQAGATIPAHHGAINSRLICHLPLIVPPGCGFRVGNEVREWREGELLIFDDTIEHEAWNRSDRDRLVLIFDIWRPELSEDERRAVTALFEAVDAYQ